MHEAKSQLSRLVEMVLAGEEVILARNGDPVARIVRFHREAATRQLGLGRGVFKTSDDFNAPMTPEELDEFIGS